MKKRTKRLMVLGLVLSMALTGCQGSDSTGAADGAASAAASADSDQTTFDVLAVRAINSDDQYLEGFVKESQETAGVTINWDIQQGSDWGDKKSVVLASADDLPDAFFGGNTLGDADIQKNPGLFIPLEDLIAENMPNLTKIMQEDPKVKALITSEDGHIYTLPKRMPGRPVVGNQFFINQTWLDNLGLEMPTTYKELEAVLEKFKTEDPNQNGVNDEIPMSGNMYRLITIYGCRLSSSTTSYMNWDPDTKKVIYNATTENYKNAMNYFNNLYKEGLLDEETFTQDGIQLGAKLRNTDISLVGVSDGWLPTLFGSHSEEYVPLPALEAPDGEKYVMMDQDPYGRNQFMITSKCENPGKLLQWIDLFYTDDASVVTYYGDFEKAVTKNDDGTYQILPGKDMAQSSYSEIMAFRDEGPKYVPDGFSEKLHFETLDGDGLKLEITKDLEPYAVENYPQVMYTDDEQNRLSTLATDINTFVNSKQAEWVTNEGCSDAEWDSYIEQLNQMGLEEFIQIHQDALDRYTANTQ